MRFCSFSAVRARCSLARPRDVTVKALGLRCLPDGTAAPSPPPPSPPASRLFLCLAAERLAAFLPFVFFLCLSPAILSQPAEAHDRSAAWMLLC